MSSVVHPQANNTSSWMQVHTRGCAEVTYLYVNIYLDKSAVCRGEELADYKICVPAYLDFHLVSTINGEVNEVVPWSYLCQPWCSLTAFIVSFPSMSSGSQQFSPERQCLHISGRLNLGHLFFKTKPLRTKWTEAMLCSVKEMWHTYTRNTHPVPKITETEAKVEDKSGIKMSKR